MAEVLSRGRAGTVLLVCVAALLATGALEARGSASVVAGAALLVVAAMPLLLRLAVWRLDGPAIYGLMCVVTFALTGLAWLGTPENAGPGLTRDDIGSTLVLVAAGVAAFACGARLAGRARAPSLSRVPIGAAPSPRALLVVFSFAFAAFGAALASGRYGYISDPDAGAGAGSQLVSLLASTSGIVVLVAAVAFFASGDARLGRVLVALVLTQAAVGLATGVKGETIGPLVFCGLAFMAYRGQTPWRAILLVVLSTLVVLVPLNATYRKAVREDGGGVVASLVRALTDSDLLRVDRVPVETARYVFARFRNVDHVALIRARRDEYAPGDGSRYYLLPMMIAVPRALWRDKPVLDEAAQFSHTYWEVPLTINTATPLTQVGDLDRNFGSLGVVIGLFVWGAVIGGWSRLLAARPTPRMLAVHLYALLSAVSYIESDLPSLVATSARTLPLVAAIAWLMLPAPGGAAGYRRLGGMIGRGLGRIRRHLSAPPLPVPGE